MLVPEQRDSTDAFVERVRAGEPAAWTRLYERFAPSLGRHLQRRWLFTVAQAEDLTQDTFERAWRHRATLRLPADATAAEVGRWLYLLCRCEAIECLREVQRAGGWVLSLDACLDSLESLASGGEEPGAVEPEHVGTVLASGSHALAVDPALVVLAGEVSWSLAQRAALQRAWAQLWPSARRGFLAGLERRGRGGDGRRAKTEGEVALTRAEKIGAWRARKTLAAALQSSERLVA